MSMDPEQIVRGCRRNDRRAQKALYDGMAPLAMGVCMRFASCRDEAQDLMQDGFVKVFERIRSLKEPQRLQSWVYSIMLNTCIDSHRRRQQFVSLDDNQELAPAILDLDPYADEEIVAAMQRLTAFQRAAFNMAEVEGYTSEEIAQRLGSNVMSVRATVSKAKKTLREILTNNDIR